MKKIYYLSAILAVCACMVSCADDGEGIGSPLDIYNDYDLPQSGASDAANQRILNYYDKYGSFVLYDFTNKDAMWVMNTGVASSGGREYIATTGDPANVDAMLDYIEEIWLDYFPDDFLKKGGMPYKIFLADSVYMKRDWGDGNIKKTAYNYYINGNSIIIAGLNKVSTMTEYEKSTRKAELFNAMWTYYKSNGLIDDPEEFYAGTDYTTKPTMTYGMGPDGYYQWFYTQDDLDALRNRGFIPNYSAYGYNVYSEIYVKYSDAYDTWTNVAESTIKANDYNYYLAQIMKATDEEAAELLKYPAVAKKWNFLIDHYKESVGVDLRAMSK